MSWLALMLAILAVPAVLLDRRWAFGLSVLAGAAAARALHRGRRSRVAIAALCVAALATGLAGWATYEIHRPASTAAIDPTPYERAGTGREVILPLRVQAYPVTKLALLEFTAGSDEIYAGLEPQWIDGPDEQGWRVIAYRNDGYVDFYDDHALTIDPNMRSQVTGKGLRDHVNVDLSDTVFEMDEAGRAHIDIDFTDVAGRRIRVAIHESTTRRSVPTGILAPVGSGSTDPDFFPLFITKDFEFIRLGGSRLEASIDGRPIELAGFPVPLPMQGQLRSYAKYSLNSEIVAVFDTTDTTLRTVTTEPGSDVFRDDGVEYLFADDALERIRVKSSEIVFEPALDVTRTGQGRVTVTTYPEHGVIGAEYRVTRDGGTARLAIDMDEVTVPRQPDLLYRLIINERTLFGTWPKEYRYRGDFDLDAGTVEAAWTNG